ncbi:uncharacterized protein LOC128251800 [Drosophila gunungcola]|uniref:Uncharacterized protein n=1 Tax=Drosophila gunungcola TaxID=103775 RepID=A0A9Q0BV54_9MUSC|nr:uncharacterized protein LOC128251800 [Drosophila gunungcola]KAI8045872.1 hypothetical protein M5D96_002061 [Drosophila gunungcola]
MSMSNLSIDGEFRYIIQWFNEWSELQRDDFVYVFVEYLARGSSSCSNDVQVNGLVNSLANAAVQDKPMSLFQCRIKLFREWSPKWPIEFKCKLQEKISEIDAKVGEKIINELRGPHSVHNGDVAVHLNANGASDEGGDSELEQPAVAEVAEVAAPVEGEESEPAPEADDNRLAAVLSQETPVDDDDVEESAGEDSNSNAEVNGHYPAAAVTTIAVNTSPSPSPTPQPIIEPVEQVENSVSVTVASAEVPPVA